MMRRFIMALLAAASTITGAVAASAQEPTPIQRIFPSEAGYAVSATKDLMAEGRRTYEGVLVEGISTRTMIDQVTFGIGEGNRVEVAVRNLTLRPVDPTRPIVLISGLRFLLDDWPAHAGADSCEWVRQIGKLQLDGLEMRLAAPDGGQPGLRVKNLNFERRREGDECWLSGILAATSVEFIARDDASFAISGLRAELRTPSTAKAAGAPEAPQAAVRASMSSLELRRPGRSPAFGFLDVTAGLDVESASIAPLLSLLDRITLTGSKANGELNLMQILNAATLFDAQMKVDAPITRIYSAGVVPPEAVTNFSRVGLSTITGKSGYAFELAGGQLRSRADVSLIGLIDATLSSSMTLRPYPRQKLEASARGIALGAHLIPDASLDDLELRYRDRGLEGYVIDLTGVPTGRYVTEFAGVLAKDGSESMKRSAAAISGALSEFFRNAARGYDMSVTAAPPERINMSRIALLALTDMQGLAKAMGLASLASRSQ
ncbi:hypothetical protein [Paracoccus sp. ME4]|uniref:hypothetical protein n=1 Tax=Paracoccus sp. ME4 TaxID=3138066 RepID=UPI00398AC30D